MALAAAVAALLSDVLNRIAEYFVTWAFAAMTILVIADVLARNIGAPISWSEELGVRFLGTWFVFMGASVAFKRGQLVSITFAVAKLNPYWQRSVRAGASLLIAAFLGVMIYYGLDLVAFTFTQRSPMLNIPMGYAYLSIPVSSAVMLIHSLALSSSASRRPPDRRPSVSQDVEAGARDA
jgi:TRAP-type transport system small permease protein